MKLSKDDIRMLADQERRMDSGDQPFVVSGGCRWAFPGHILDDAGVISGQTASHTILQALMEANMRALEAEIAARKLQEEPE